MVLVVALFAAWRIFQPERDAAWERVQATQVIVFATDATFPPFSALNIDGEYFGFDIDLARAIAERLGVRAEFDLVGYDGLIGTLVVGRSDAVISAQIVQPHRLNEAAYSQPYFNAGTVLVLPADAAAPAGADALRWAENRTLAVEFGSQGDVIVRRWARRVVGVRSLAYPTVDAALQAVIQGDADGALVEAVTAFELVSGQAALQVATPVEDVPYAIAVSARSPQLMRAIDRVLHELEADGTLGELRERWLGPSARTLRFVADR